MNDDWKILGIEPTTDPIRVKRAYATALRIHHPETDPAGFQRLREAYERQLDILKVPRNGSQANSATPRSVPASSAPEPPRAEAVPPAPPAPAPSQGTVSLDLDGQPSAGAAIEPPSPRGHVDLAPSAPPPAWAPPIPPAPATAAMPDTPASQGFPGWDAPWPTLPAAPVDTPARSGPDSDRDLMAEWKRLWATLAIRRDLASLNQFLSGDIWWDISLRRRLEAEILGQLQTSWSESEPRRIPDEAWYHLDLHFGWWNRERELARVYIDEFVDDLLERVQRSGARVEPTRYPPRAPTTAPRTSHPIPLSNWDDSDAEPSNPLWLLGKRGTWFVISMVFMLIRACSSSYESPSYHDQQSSYPSQPPIHYEPVQPARELGSPFGFQAPEIHPWTDETGGLLPRTCDQTPELGEECQLQSRISVVLGGRQLSRRLLLVRGQIPLETLQLQLEPDQRIRLCSKGPTDLVVLEQGADPCSSKVVKAWRYRGEHLVKNSTAKVTCETSRLCQQLGGPMR